MYIYIDDKLCNDSNCLSYDPTMCCICIHEYEHTWHYSLNIYEIQSKSHNCFFIYTIYTLSIKSHNCLSIYILIQKCLIFLLNSNYIYGSGNAGWPGTWCKIKICAGGATDAMGVGSFCGIWAGCIGTAGTESVGLCSCCRLLKNGMGARSLDCHAGRGLGCRLGGAGTSAEDPMASEKWDVASLTNSGSEKMRCFVNSA